LPRLNANSNVRTIGYVRTGSATRDIDTVLDEVSTYASWTRNNTNGNNNTDSYGLYGIFFDEAPNNYTSETGRYMTRIDEFVKNHTTDFGEMSFVFCLLSPT